MDSKAAGLQAPASDDAMPVPGEAGSLYAIGSAQWQAIDQRVDAVIAAREIGSEIEQFVPNYNELLPACSAWKTSTFPQLVQQSVLVGTLATNIADQLASMSQAIAKLDPAAPLPSVSSFIDRARFAAFAADARSYAATAQELAPQVATFVATNQVADRALAAVVADLPPEWASVGGPLANLELAFPAVEQAWGTIEQQLAALASIQQLGSSVFLVQVELSTAAESWTRLSAAALAFNARVASQS